MENQQSRIFEELVKEAIIANGGDVEDLKYYDEKKMIDAAIRSTAKKITLQGYRSRTSNPTYFINPLNKLSDGQIEKLLWSDGTWYLKKILFKTESKNPEFIELIKLKPDTTENSLKQIDELGFIPAPSPYVLGLVIQHSEVPDKYRNITSLDEGNIFEKSLSSTIKKYPSFLYLNHSLRRNSIDLVVRDTVDAYQKDHPHSGNDGWNGIWSEERSEEHTSDSSHSDRSRMPSSA